MIEKGTFIKFLKHFPKNSEGLYMLYEPYSFDNFFRLLLKNGIDYEEAMDFMIFSCSLSAPVFQERIHSKKYLTLLAEDVLSPKSAAIKAKLIYDLLN